MTQNQKISLNGLTPTRGSKPHSSATATTLPRCERGRRSPLLNGAEGIWCSPCIVKRGFTLAEVLITLSIIGVVAAVTLPTLIQNYKKHVVETRLEKFYSMINQAIQMSETVNGDKKYWDSLQGRYETNEEGEPDYSKPQALAWFEKYLKPYIKYTKYEIINGNDSQGHVLIYFEDGSLLRFNKYVWHFVPMPQNLKLVEDEAGRKTVDYGNAKKYVFLFEPTATAAGFEYHYNKGVEPYAWDWDGKRESLFNISNTYNDYTCSNKGGAYCTKLIQLNGWKIPKDYPVKF